MITDFSRLKEFLNTARYSSLYGDKDVIVRFFENQATLCTPQGNTIQVLKLSTLFQVNYDTILGKDMIVFTPRGTSQYSAALLAGFEKNIAVNCNVGL